MTYSDKIVDQSGYRIEVTKEICFYVTASNNVKDDFSIYTYSIVVTQNGKQYKLESNYNADYDELIDDIKPGITSSGIPTFPALEANDFNLIIEGSSDDLDIDLEKFQFLLDVK